MSIYRLTVFLLERKETASLKKGHSSKSRAKHSSKIFLPSLLSSFLSFLLFFSRKDYNLKNDLALISYAARCSRPVPVMSIQCVSQAERTRRTRPRGVCLLRRLLPSSPIQYGAFIKKKKKKNRDTMTLLSAGKGLIILVANPSSKRKARETDRLACGMAKEKEKEEREREKKAALKEVADDVLGERRIPGKAEFLSIK